MTEDRAWKQWKRDRSVPARDFLLSQYDGLALERVKAVGLTSGISEREDAVQVARTALYTALMQFDMERGVKFVTFARHVIQWLLIKHVRHQKESSLYRNERGKMGSALKRLAASGQASPSDEDVAAEAKLPLDTVMYCRKPPTMFALFSQCAYTSPQGGESMSVEDFGMSSAYGYAPEEMQNPEDILLPRQGFRGLTPDGKNIYELIALLPEKPRSLLQGRMEGRTFEELAEAEGVSRQTVYVRYTRAVNTLRGIVR